MSSGGKVLGTYFGEQECKQATVEVVIGLLVSNNTTENVDLSFVSKFTSL